MNKEDKLYSMLGLAQKGKNVISGTEGSKNAVLNRNAELVILSEDCGINTIKFFSDKCKYRNIPFIMFGNRENLGKVLGKGERIVVTILDDGIAKSIVKLYNELNNS